MLHDAFQIVFRQDEEAIALDAQPLRPELELLHRLLAGDVEDRAVSARHLAGQLQEERRLADAGIASDQDQGTGDDAAAQHLVQLAHGEPEAVRLGEMNVFEG